MKKINLSNSWTKPMLEMCLVTLCSYAFVVFCLVVKIYTKIITVKRKLSFLWDWFLSELKSNIHKKKRDFILSAVVKRLVIYKALPFTLCSCYLLLIFWYWYCLYLLRWIVIILTVHFIWFRLFSMISYEKSFANAIYSFYHDFVWYQFLNVQNIRRFRN